MDQDYSDESLIYVAGYLALYDKGDKGELLFTRETVKAALPPASILPINIDHKSKCIIGAVLAIVDDFNGPFFLGIINCPQLVNVLSSSANVNFFGSKKDKLTKVEQLLYLISNYLPSASLSSRKLLHGEDPDDTLFAHVALCVIGKRVGTIVTYDITPEAAISPFKYLSKDSSNNLLSQANETKLKLESTKWNLNEELLTQALLSTAVNNMLLKDRWRLVSTRRKEAGISGHIYLQASSQFGLDKNNVLNGVEFDETDPKNIEKEDAPLVISHFNSNPDKTVLDFCTVQTKDTITMASPNTIPSKPPTNGDYILVPSAQYNQLIVSQHAQQVPISHMPYTQTSIVPPPHMIAPYTSQVLPSQFSTYNYPSHHSNLEAQISALVGALAAERKNSRVEFSPENFQRSPPYSYDRKLSRKRKYDWDLNQRDEFDHIYYPGEHPPKIAPKQSDSLSELIGAVSSLQQEITQLRSMQKGCIKPDYANQNMFAYPTMQCQIPQVIAQSNSSNQPISHVLPQSISVDTQTKPNVPLVDSGQGDGIKKTKTSNYTTIDASAISSINTCDRDDADIFVSQIMNSR
ncbi:capsid maturation protease [Canid alphaherpesvirus 1]|nr:capsid maturation protease [Canid alphaherpesvirus 1]QQL08437.1 capsid maturation protease [Canid alphaherpesvirus 1]WHU31605.1 capsid maturation protease [Canid alphaherpesvirus 1]WHU31679.1 capsid maturation protease [Canid alphaherpesvirus 1]